jgi:hypothetical protein
MRIWDKDFNLIWSGRSDDQIYVTVDSEDERVFSGPMKVEFQ